MKQHFQYREIKNQTLAFWPTLICLLGLLFPASQVLAQCNPDTDAPVPTCQELIEVNYDPSGVTNFNAGDLIETCFDPYNCSTFTYRGALWPSNTLPGSNIVPLIGTGTFTVVVWPIDAAGNFGNKCWGQVSVVANNSCNPDQTPPVCVAPANISLTADAYQALNVDLNNNAQMDSLFGAPTATDNCDSTGIIFIESYNVVLYQDGSPKVITRSFWAFDGSFNGSNIPEQTISIFPTFTIHVPGDYHPGDSFVDTLSYNSSVNFLVKAYSDLLYAAPCSNTISRTDRTWNVINWSGNFTPSATLPALDINNDGQTGDAYDVIALNEYLWLYINNVPVQQLMPQANLYDYVQHIRYDYLDTASYQVNGTVFLDETTNRSYDNGETTLQGWRVKAIGQPSNRVYSAVTNSSGAYNLLICPDDTSAEISLDVPYNFANSCPNTYSLNLNYNTAATQNIPVTLADSCHLMSVDLATPSLRPCFSSYYDVHYCNYSTETITGSYVDVALDTFIHYNSSTLPAANMGNNVYRFLTGNVSPGVCADFKIYFSLDCAAPSGMTHCTEANIYPQDDCQNFQAWNGPNLVANSYCDGDSVHLILQNNGLGGMSEQLDFIVVEDLIIYMQNHIQLGSGQQFEVVAPANGQTWRIESPQVPLHPWGGVVSSAIEGCNGASQPGLVNMFVLSNPNPFTAIDCRENSNSWDPNDKQAFPTGYGVDHQINPNTDIEYMIRFQNTGTDIAHQVVLYDTLSPFLDAHRVRPGAASHAYDFDILGDHVIRFRFDNIELPDSNTNAAASHGFVKFLAPQVLNNPIGTVINNDAAIYFDFNPAVITNQTTHLIDTGFIKVVSATHNPGGKNGALKVYPNPSAGPMYFEMEHAVADAQFVLTDLSGRTVLQASFSGNKYQLQPQSLQVGMYLYQIRDKSGLLFSGKIVLK